MIWAFKLPTLPIILLGFIWRFFTEIWNGPIVGWMLIFRWSCCWFGIGYDCIWSKKFSYWSLLDLTFWQRTPVEFMSENSGMNFSDAMHSYFSVPKIEEFGTRKSFEQSR